MKKCSTCQETKSLSEFNKHAGKKDGLQTVCRECNRTRSQRYYAENKEKHRNYVALAAGGKECASCGKIFRSKERNKECGPCRYEKSKKDCPNCGSKMSPKAVTCRQCLDHSGENNPNWGDGRVGTSGYVYVRDDGRYVPEHRLVMEAYLGRQLLEGENVHHKNGVRDDNRRENLELWTRPQPVGIRAHDALTWAKEIVTLYQKDEEKLKGL